MMCFPSQIRLAFFPSGTALRQQQDLCVMELPWHFIGRASERAAQTSWERFRARDMFLSPVISHSAKQDVTHSWVFNELFTSWTAMGSFIHAELSSVEFLSDENWAARLALTVTLMSVEKWLHLLGCWQVRSNKVLPWGTEPWVWGLGLGWMNRKCWGGRWHLPSPLAYESMMLEIRRGSGFSSLGIPALHRATVEGR